MTDTLENADFHVNCGNASLTQGDLFAAAESYRKALSLDPLHFAARLKLAHVLKISKDYNGAEVILRALAAEYPDNALVHKEFGRLNFAREKIDEAFASFQAVLVLSPDDADTHHWLANIEHVRGNAAASQFHYQRSVALKPLMRVPAAKTPADFSVLFLFAPGAANTPPDALIKMADYDSYFLLLVAGVEYDAKQLRNSANLVVNLISDVDQGREILPVAEALVERIGLPVINSPRGIMKTDRVSAATLLSGIPFCHVPWARYYDNTDYSWPVLVRVAGTHGGKDFEKIDDKASLKNFVTRYPNADFYVTEYIDYQSADGFFRKYRFIFAGDKILPYHLAIGNGWKVHHATTDMADHAWMQREEESFLQNPHSVFNKDHWAALHTIRKAFGLDFFGIDCAIDNEGNLVVFEVNASMLVHREGEKFIYKLPHIDCIKSAFDAMLRNRALKIQ